MRKASAVWGRRARACAAMIGCMAGLGASTVVWAADLTLGALFADHMVLPRTGAKVYGTAGSNEAVTLKYGDVTRTVTAGADGAFSLSLPDLKNTDAVTLSVTTASGSRRELSDVIPGDVFLCSGQSNMVLEVRRSLNTDSVLGASANDRIRLLKVTPEPAFTPQTQFKTPVEWQKASPATVGNWSGACYFFAEALYKATQTPVGLVVSAFGGSGIRAWIDAPNLKTLGGYDEGLGVLDAYVRDPEAAGRQFGGVYESWWRKAGGVISLHSPWQAVAADLKGWAVVPDISQNWERWGVPELAAYDGGMWYALSFTLTAAQAAKGADMALGQIDEIDMSWVNGKPVGYTSGAGAQRLYRLPSGTLKAGENTLIINAVDTWGNGGVYGNGPRELRLKGGEVIPLNNGWRYKAVPSAYGPPPRAPWDATGGLTTLSNAMIAPMGPFPFKAALWYQGESNTGDGLGYQPMMAALIRDWRTRFGADLGIAVVQLANYGPRPTAPGKSGWAEVREAQRLAVRADSKATLVTAVDIGDPYDIHPANKNELGRRLARAVLVKLYGQAGKSESGPVVASVKRSEGGIDVRFSGLEGVMIAYGGPQPLGFELCDGPNSNCRYATAAFVAPDTVRLNAVDMASAKWVRFCWADSPVCTLYDKANGLPAIPFAAAVE